MPARYHADFTPTRHTLLFDFRAADFALEFLREPCFDEQPDTYARGAHVSPRAALRHGCHAAFTRCRFTYRHAADIVISAIAATSHAVYAANIPMPPARRCHMRGAMQEAMPRVAMRCHQHMLLLMLPITAHNTMSQPPLTPRYACCLSILFIE